MAALAIAEGAATCHRVVDAAGPTTEPFADFIRFLRGAIGGRSRLIHVPVGLAVALAWPPSMLLRDVMITREELGALKAELLISHAEPTTPTSFQAWVETERPALGSRYTSEIGRHWSHS